MSLVSFQLVTEASENGVRMGVNSRSAPATGELLDVPQRMRINSICLASI